MGDSINNFNNNQEISGLQTSSATQEMIDSFDSNMQKFQVNRAVNEIQAPDREGPPPPSPLVGNQDNSQIFRYRLRY